MQRPHRTTVVITWEWCFGRLSHNERSEMLKLSQTTAASFLLCQLILKPTEMDGLLIRKFERSRGFFVVNSTDSCAIFGSVGASYQPGKVKEQRARGVTVKSRKSGLISKSSGGSVLEKNTSLASDANCALFDWSHRLALSNWGSSFTCVCVNMDLYLVLTHSKRIE